MGVAVPQLGLGGLLALMYASCLLLPLLLAAQESKLSRPATPVIFNLGDSNSDTGGGVAGLGYDLPLSSGRTFFNRSAGRFSDGRLVIDFLCERVGSNYLSPYLEAVGSNFTSGANYAVAGAATARVFNDFTLAVQVRQHLHFKSRRSSSHLFPRGSVEDEYFSRAVYTIDIGQNDLSGGFTSGLSYDQVVAKIPAAVSSIRDAIQTLHESGAKKFWVHNTGPLGCLPSYISQLKRNESRIDNCGCLAELNDAARAFNSALSVLCDRLRTELAGAATLVLTDVYSIKSDLICNHSRNGFGEPLSGCCGGAAAACCSLGERRVSWDGVHYTEAANRAVAARVLSADHSNPKIKFEDLIRL